jgi:hypothetical protein
MRTTHLTLAAFVLAATGCADTDGHVLTETSQPAAPFDGVFEYMVEGSEGLSFYLDGYFVHFRVPEGIDGAAADLTDAMVNEWWAGAVLSSGTYTVVGDTVTCRFRFNRNPARVGESFRWVGEFSRDTLTWRVLDEEGAVETVGRSLRLR